MGEGHDSRPPGQQSLDKIELTEHPAIAAAQQLIKLEDWIMADDVIRRTLRDPDLPPQVRTKLETFRRQANVMLRETKARTELNEIMSQRKSLTAGDLNFRLNRWLELYPEHPEAPMVSLELGRLYQTSGADERARDSFYRTLTSTLAKAAMSSRVNVEHAQLLTKIAKWEVADSEYHNANWRRALELFDRFLTQHIESGVLVESAMFRKADCYYQLRDGDNAVASYRMALALAPFHPFAPEAWLRLFHLYSLRGGNKERVEAIESFIWLVNNLNPEEQEYWQQRLALFLLRTSQSTPEQLLAIFESFPTDPANQGWQRVRQTYADLLARQNTASPEAQKSASSTDEWVAWDTQFNQKGETIRKQTDEFIRKTEAKYLHKPGDPVQN
jgi:tetratricopeptide (TPR) repeat protein